MSIAGESFLVSDKFIQVGKSATSRILISSFVNMLSV